MYATIIPINEEMFAAFKAGNSAALQEIFRECYHLLVGEAESLLAGNGAAAARAVESAFVDAWRARATIATADMLGEGLHASMHDAATRSLSRRQAARKFDRADDGDAPKARRRAAPNVDEAWDAVDGRLRVDRDWVESEMRDAKLNARERAAVQRREIAKPRSRAVAITMTTLAVVMCAGSFVYFRGQMGYAARLDAGLRATDVSTTRTGDGELTILSLGDKSKVKVGPASQIRIAPNFGTKMRGMELAGTARFTVAPAVNLPFVVRAGNVYVKATGTDFTVRSYAEDHRTLVFVTEGSVEVTVRDSIVAIGRGSALVISSAGDIRIATPEEVNAAAGWVDGTINVANRPLSEALVEFKRWFGVELVAADSSLLTRVVTLQAKEGAYDEAIASLEKSGALIRGLKGTHVALADARK